MNMSNIPALKKIPPEVLSAAHAKLDELTRLLKPYLVLLSQAERQAEVRFGAELMRFLELSHTFSLGSPELFPSYIKEVVFRESFFTVHALWELLGKINHLRDYLWDTETLTGSYALEIAFAFYQNVKIAARRDIPGAGTIYEELKPAFPPEKRRRRKPKKVTDDRQLELFEDIFA